MIKIQFLSLLISNTMSWKLSEIYEALNKNFENIENIKLTGVSIDSRKINKNDFYKQFLAKILMVKILLMKSQILE